MNNNSGQSKDAQDKLDDNLDLRNLASFVEMPREDLGVEYKSWLNLKEKHAQATLVKATIAIANHGGGFIVLGFEESGNNKILASIPKPVECADITQDDINSVIQKFVTSDFHCEVHFVSHQETGVKHPIIRVPGGQKEPVMSKRDGEGLLKHRCYIRKPGPKSEEPKTSEEWRELLNRCVRANREDMLDAIRTIISGEATSTQTVPDARKDLKDFCDSAFSRWQELIKDLPEQAPQRCPHGFYEMGFALQGANSVDSLETLNQRLAVARRIKMTGWTPFLEVSPPQWTPYPYNQEIIEAWLGKPDRSRFIQESAFSNFWRVSCDGKLYTLTGYQEDQWRELMPGECMDINMPVWQVGEAAYFVERFCAEFPEVENVSIYLKFFGLNGRKLISIDGRRFMTTERISRTPEVKLETSVSVSQLRNNMIEVIYKLLKPLYETFQFFPLSSTLVDEELSKLRKGSF